MKNSKRKDNQALESGVCTGLTRLEWMAGQVATGWFTADNVAASDAPEIVRIAAAILEACERREANPNPTED